MSKSIQLGDTCDRYTPDAGTVDGPIYCRVCGTEMNVVRNCYGATSFAEAMGKHGHACDEFYCPHRLAEWHFRVAALRGEASKFTSDRLKQIVREEADEILRANLPQTKEGA